MRKKFMTVITRVERDYNFLKGNLKVTSFVHQISDGYSIPLQN